MNRCREAFPPNDYFDRHLCSADPFTIGALALGAIAGFGGSALMSGGGSAPTPQAPPAMAPPQQQPQARPARMQQPSFLGAAATPPAAAAGTGSGQKTLLGQ